MNIALLGATGKFGITFTTKLLSNPDYQITAISKSAERIFEDSHRITAKSIDATNQKELKKVIKDADVVYCAISGEDLPKIAENLVEINVKRLIFLSVVGIYNELEEGNGAEFNLDNEAEQIPNRKSVDIIEASDLNYTIIRSGYLINGKEDEYIITKKGETPKGYCSTVESVLKVSLDIINDAELYSHESISITRDMTKN